jgi:hypothetical protein
MRRLTRSKYCCKKHKEGQMRAVITVSPQDCDAVLFDLDGVLTRTASVHASAWKKALRQLSRAAFHSGRSAVRPTAPHCAV